MGTQNLNNYYFNKVDAKINYSSYYDFYLASDGKDFQTEVVYSNNIIGYDNGFVLPTWIDLDDSLCSQKSTLTCDSIRTYSPGGEPIVNPYLQVILSKNYWPEATTDCPCPFTGTQSGSSAYTIFNISLTGIDNGLFTGMTSASTIDLYNILPQDLTFSANSYDRRFKMHQVRSSNFTNHATPYNDNMLPKSGYTSYAISSTTDNSGYYQELNGGFYQGFYKLYGYPYEVLPNRTECGWTMETFLKLRVTGSTSPSSASTCFSTNHNQCAGYLLGSVTGGSNLGSSVWITDGSCTHVGCGSGDDQPYYDGSVTYSAINNLDSFVVTPVDYTFPIRYAYIPNKVVQGKSYEFLFTISDYTGGYVSPQAGTFIQSQELFSGNGRHRSTAINAGVDPYGGMVPWACAKDCLALLLRFDDEFGGVVSDIVVREKTTLNDINPNNTGFFYYQGTRAENKFWEPFSAETGCTSFTGYCSETGLTGDTCTLDISSGATGYTTIYELDCCNGVISANTLGPTKVKVKKGPCTTEERYLPVSAISDTYSNAFGVRMTPDFKLGYRALRYTGSCVTTGTSVDCNTGGVFNCGYNVEEAYSDVICPVLVNSGTCEDTWIQVSVVYERDVCFSGCNLENKGGLNDLLKTPTFYEWERYGYDDVKRCNDEYPLIPEDGYYDLECSGATQGLTSTGDTGYGKWLSEKDLREGTLSFYVNGRRVMKVENFEEIIPRALNTHRNLQVGVPFNMSWGGGSQGLYENVTYQGTGCTGSPPYVQDANDLGLLIEKHFAGSWMGGISQFRYYIKPLQADEIYHNFLVNKDRYSLIDCEFHKNCTRNVCSNPQTLYYRDGDSLDIKVIFEGPNMNNVFVGTDGQNIKFKSDLQENISSVTYKKNNEEVSLPFILRSSDNLEIIISAMDSSINSIITLIGNEIK